MGRHNEHQADVSAVEAVLAGDRARFRELVERYDRRVYLTVVRMVRRAADAEDLTQQAFFEGYVALARYDRQRSFLTWLLRIAVNNCKDYLKSHKRRETSMQVDTDDQRAIHTGHIPGPQDATQSHQVAARIEEALATLEEKYRLPVLLRDVEGLSYAEIQQVLDLPLTTLKIRVVRARQQLQAQLGDLRDD
jgi:RNA polymerase sigma-70 factor (ECF subfamily)